MSEQQDRAQVGIAREKDDGLRQLLTWTFVALIAAVLLALLGVSLVIRWFDVAAG